MRSICGKFVWRVGGRTKSGTSVSGGVPGSGRKVLRNQQLPAAHSAPASSRLSLSHPLPPGPAQDGEGNAHQLSPHGDLGFPVPPAPAQSVSCFKSRYGNA